MFWEDRCAGCGDCVKACPTGAITRSDGSSPTTGEKCRLCGSCVEACFAGAREMIGRKVTVAEVMSEIEKDIVFYDQSGGGVTFSGGEPLMQPDFLLNLLEHCEVKHIHTAVDTTGFARIETLLDVSKYVDLFLYDLKLMDDTKHKRFTGVSNRLILRNLKELSLQHKNIIIRFPLIPGITDDDQNIDQLIDMVKSLSGVNEINILPYHNTGMDKYERLKMPYKLSQTKTPPQEKVDEIAEKVKNSGLKVKIGG